MNRLRSAVFIMIFLSSGCTKYDCGTQPTVSREGLIAVTVIDSLEHPATHVRVYLFGSPVLDSSMRQTRTTDSAGKILFDHLPAYHGELFCLECPRLRAPAGYCDYNLLTNYITESLGRPYMVGRTGIEITQSPLEVTIRIPTGARYDSTWQ